MNVFRNCAGRRHSRRVQVSRDQRAQASVFLPRGLGGRMERVRPRGQQPYELPCRTRDRVLRRPHHHGREGNHVLRLHERKVMLIDINK